MNILRPRLWGGSALLAAAWLLVLPGCASQVPPRPVPQLEASPTLPPWYPEQPWNQASQDDRVYYTGKVVFDTGRHAIRPEAEAVLRQLLAWLQANPDVSRVRLEGHTDTRASDEYNQKLSERRSIAVADWLVDNGFDHNRLLAVAFGESRPLATNDSAVGRQENRRSSFHVAEVGGRRFKGQDPTAGGLVLTVLSREERDAMKNVGEVPTYEPPPAKPIRDVFEPEKKKVFKGMLDSVKKAEETEGNAPPEGGDKPEDGKTETEGGAKTEL
ncbi:MAG: OmpA family protein [Deltaproteobacteria bacterium]|nr:MAG: OmpA family protein [Deltaproteobacteria bacterium]